MKNIWDKFKIAAFFACCLVFLLELNADATDTLPLSKSRNAGTVHLPATAILTIVSDTGESEACRGMPAYGHTFLVLENISDVIIDLCGRKIVPGENITFGWWAISSHSGLWFGLESNYIDAFGRYRGRVALSREIDASGIERLEDYLLTHDLYTPLENCAVRAVAAFNTAIPKVRELRCGYFTTPARVYKAILTQGGSHEAALAIDFDVCMPSTGFGDEIECYSFAIKKKK